MVKASAAVVAALMVVGAGSVPAWANGSVQPRPSIVLVAASPQSLSSSGGYVTVRVQVRHASRCSIQGQLAARAAFGPIRTMSCSLGRATARLRVAANGYTAAATIHFRVTARSGNGFVARSTVAVVQAAHSAPPPPAAALTIATSSVPDASVGVGYNAALAATGGSPPYLWAIAGGALPPGLTLSVGGVLAGTPTTAGQWSFSARVSDSAGQTVTVPLSLNVAAATTVTTYLSSNWSGYVLSGGPFTAVTGTFNVPTIYSSATDTDTSEWVGLDGAFPSDPTIIQAGVDEQYTAATNTYITFAWIELYPALPFSAPVPVRPGDQVTVTIGQVSPGLWNVLVKDDSNGVGYSVNQAYAGPALSAEWIVEAPWSVATQSVETLGAFSPVTFTGVGVNPVAGELSRLVMVQNGVPVATPSALSPNGFTVGNGTVTPAAP